MVPMFTSSFLSATAIAAVSPTTFDVFAMLRVVAAIGVVFALLGGLLYLFTRPKVTAPTIMLLVTSLALIGIAIVALHVETSNRTLFTVGDTFGITLSDATYADADEIHAGFDAALAAASLVVTIDDETHRVRGSSIGLYVDDDDFAYFFTRIPVAGPLTSRFNDPVVPAHPQVSYDQAKLDGLVTDLESRSSADPVSAVVMKTTDRFVVKPSTDGSVVTVDPDLIIEGLVHSASSKTTSSITFQTVDINPVYATPDAAALATRLNEIVARPWTFTSDDDTYPDLVIAPASTLASLSVVDGAPFIDIYALTREYAPVLAELTIDPVDATLVVGDDNLIVVTPSSAGSITDMRAVGLYIATSDVDTPHTTELPRTSALSPAISTEDLSAMLPLSKVSEFTTHHRCCENRVTNIQLLADELDRAVVMSGETFSLNEYAGPRTLEEGYKRAGAIINGRVSCCDSPINVGGGTSQLATTFYNAIFEGCYEDVFHQPHSMYFSRYPFVREATLGYPLPDVIFRNDTDYPVVIRTHHTPTSITVELWGNTQGRTCTSETTRSGRSGTVTRTITYPDGEVATQEWSWHYNPTQH